MTFSYCSTRPYQVLTEYLPNRQHAARLRRGRTRGSSPPPTSPRARRSRRSTPRPTRDVSPICSAVQTRRPNGRDNLDVERRPVISRSDVSPGSSTRWVRSRGSNHPSSRTRRPSDHGAASSAHHGDEHRVPRSLLPRERPVSTVGRLVHPIPGEPDQAVSGRTKFPVEVPGRRIGGTGRRRRRVGRGERRLGVDLQVHRHRCRGPSSTRRRVTTSRPPAGSSRASRSGCRRRRSRRRATECGPRAAGPSRRRRRRWG